MSGLLNEGAKEGRKEGSLGFVKEEKRNETPLCLLVFARPREKYIELMGQHCCLLPIVAAHGGCYGYPQDSDRSMDEDKPRVQQVCRRRQSSRTLPPLRKPRAPIFRILSGLVTPLTAKRLITFLGLGDSYFNKDMKISLRLSRDLAIFRVTGFGYFRFLYTLCYRKIVLINIQKC